MSERLLRVCEVVSYLQVPGKHVYELIKRKALPAMRLHRRTLVDPAKFQSWMEMGGTPLDASEQ